MADSQEPDSEEQDIFVDAGETTGQIINIHGDLYHAMEDHGLTLQAIEELGEDAIMEDAYARRILHMMRSDSPESDDPGEVLMMRDFSTSRVNTSPVLGESAEQLAFEEFYIPNRSLTTSPNPVDEDINMWDTATPRRMSLSTHLEDMAEENNNISGNTASPLSAVPSLGSPMSAVASLGSHSSTNTVIWSPQANERPKGTSPAPVVRRQVWETTPLRRSPPPFPRVGPFRFLDLPVAAKEAIYRYSVDKECDVRYMYENMTADLNTGIWLPHNRKIRFKMPALTNVCRETRRDMKVAIKKVPRVLYPSMNLPFLNELNELNFDVNEPSTLAPSGAANLRKFTMFWLFTKKWGEYQTHTSTDTAFNMMAMVTITTFPAGIISVRSTPKTGAVGPDPYYDDGELVAWLERARIPFGSGGRKRPNPGYWQRWSVVEFETANVADAVEALHKALWDVDLLNPINYED